METFNVGDQETCANCGEILNDYMVADGCDHCEDCFRYYEEHGVHAPTQPAAPEIEAAPAASAFKRKSLTNIILSVMDHKQAESADDTIARLQAENAALKDALEDEVARTSEQSEKADFWKLLSDKHADRADENYRAMLDCQKQLADADAVNKATIAALENAQRVNGAQADEMIAARTNEERYRKALSDIHAIAITSKGGFNSMPMNKIFYAAHQTLSGTDTDDD